MLEVTGLTKRFGATAALQGASFRCEPGKVLALLGENGAGKSTLVGIVAGVVRADGGSVAIDGTGLHFRSARDARAAGIGVAFQELSLVRTMTVAQNLLLANEPRSQFGLLKAGALRARARDLLRQGDVHGVDVDTPVEGLPLSVRQKLEILRAIIYGERVCLLDEPTSALAAEDVGWFEARLQQMRELGRTVVFISHRLPEIRRFCDEVTVLRQGRTEGTWAVAEVTDDQLVTAMLGRQLEAVYPKREPVRLAGRPLLRAVNLTTREGSLRASLEVRPGEVVGVAALQGQGQDLLFRGLFGDYPTRADTLEVNGRPKHLASPRAAVGADIGFVPEDRRTEGLLLDLSAERNLTVTVLGQTSMLGLVRPSVEREKAASVIQHLRVTRTAPWEPVARLSGGTQQKLVVGKWLARGSRLLLLYDPTRGVDVATKHDIYELLRRQATTGGGALWYSTDLEELANVCDRVLVMRSGHVTAEFAPPELDASGLLAEMLKEDDEMRKEQRLDPASVAGAQAIRSQSAAAPRRQGALPRSWSWPLRAARPTLVVLALAVLLFLLEASTSSGGFTALNVQSVLNDSLGVGIAAMGETFVLLIGGFDLSAGGIVSLLNVLLATQLRPGVPSEVGWVALGVLAGAGMGFLNGASVVWLRLQGIVVTLASGFVWSGFALLVLSAPGGNVPANFISGLTGMWGGSFPRATLALLFVVLLWSLLLRSPLGPRLYAVGSDPRAAVTNGISADATVILAYSLSGAFYGLAASFFTAQTAGGDPGLGGTLLLTFFAAAAVGGVRLGGGRGSAVGALIGGFVLQLIEEVLFAFGVSSYYTYVFDALVLVVAVAVTGWARVRRRKPPALPVPTALSGPQRATATVGPAPAGIAGGPRDG
ncbi:MAG: ATP-binding cassette domain-containing protein [Actinomycetota bacterium]|nr:ATP-binding cassette domain-containing protein [Actinomycetota bacterium]